MKPFFLEQREARLRLMRLIWGSLLISSMVFGVLVYSQPAPERVRAPEELAAAPGVQFGLGFALLMIVLSRLASRFLLNPRVLAATKAKAWTAESLATLQPPPKPEEIAKFLEFNDSERGQWPLLQPYFVATIVSCAFSESASVMGFVQAFQLRDGRVFLPFAALAVVGFLMARPSEAGLEKLVSK